jgi:hypothetical protein
MGKTNRSFKFRVEVAKRTGIYSYQSRAKCQFDSRPRKQRTRRDVVQAAIKE